MDESHNVDQSQLYKYNSTKRLKSIKISPIILGTTLTITATHKKYANTKGKEKMVISHIKEITHEIANYRLRVSLDLDL